MKEFDIDDFKEAMEEFRDLLEEAKENDPEYNGEVENVLKAVTRLEKEFETISTTDELNEKIDDFEEDFILVFRSMEDFISISDEGMNGIEEMQDLHFDWFEKFYVSSTFKTLTSEQQDEADAFLTNFSDNLIDLGLEDPETWDEESVEEVCLMTFPAEDASLIQDFGPILIAFFDFLNEAAILENAKACGDRVRQIRDEITEV